MDEPMQNGNDHKQLNAQEDKSMTIKFDRDKFISSIVLAELVLLLVFGWQLFSVKQELASDPTLAGNDKTIYQGPRKDAKVPPEEQPSQVDLAGPVDVQVTNKDHIRGNVDAPITIVEYSDFECPFCGRVQPTLEQIFDEYGDNVRLVYRHFPLSFHARAQKAGEASECADDQGKFWEYHDLLFANQSSLSGGIAQLKEWAGELGLNQQRFDDCLDNGNHAATVKNGLASGSQKGVTGTPGFFVNGISLSGAQPFEAFSAIIDSELERLDS